MKCCVLNAESKGKLAKVKLNSYAGARYHSASRAVLRSFNFISRELKIFNKKLMLSDLICSKITQSGE
jgi:hypothetical protein